MASKWRILRVAAGISLHQASARAGVTPTTGRVFELVGPEAIKDTGKRASCIAVWSSFSAPASSEVA